MRRGRFSVWLEKMTRFLSSDGFFNRGLTTAVFRSRGTMPVVLRDVLMMFVMVGKRMSRFS